MELTNIAALDNVTTVLQVTRGELKYDLTVIDKVTESFVVVRPHDTSISTHVNLHVPASNLMRVAHEAIEIATGNGRYI